MLAVIQRKPNARAMPTVPDRHACVATRLIAVVLAFSTSLSAQPTAASMTTINQPASGQATFDGSGNVYYLNNGPVTPGAAQTQPGGGTCSGSAFPVGIIAVACSDAQIVKVDSMGNVVY